MASLNKVFFLGNVGRDAELRYTQDGTPVASFSLAVNEGSGDNKSTMWVKVTTWGKLAEDITTRFAKKGAQILAEGKLMYDKATGGARTWTSDAGNVRANIEMTAYQLTVTKFSETTDNTEPDWGDNEEEIPF